MRAARIGDFEYAAIEDQITHVLFWRPRWATKRGGTPAWELVTLAEFRSGSDVYPPEVELPEDAPMAALADWVGQRLGYPVALHRDTQTFIVPSRLRASTHSPVCYVVPARRS